MTKPTLDPQVAVIILCWNNRDLLEECIESIYQQTYSNYRIILVDNGSTDGSVPYVKKQYPGITLIETGENLGFAIGNNIGIKRALENPDCKYAALLNTDATIDPDWIETLVAFAQKHPKLASVQSPTVDYYDHKVLDSCGILIDRQALATQMGYRQTNIELETRRVFGVNAAAAIFSRAFLEAQPFGEDYLDHDLWMYLEDVDIATRAVMMGWENWFLNESKAYHMGSASSGKNPGFSLYMTYRNNALVLIKNLPWRIIVKTLPGLMRAEMHRLRGFWREGKYPLIKAIIKGRFNSFLRIPIFVAKRREFKKYWKVTEAELWEYMKLPVFPKTPPEKRPYGTESVTVIVLSHNNMGRLEGCLKALMAEKYPDIRIIIVDNNSTDGSLQYIEEKHPNLMVLAQKANLGIANGFNVGLTKALLDEPDYAVFLRADTQIDAGWIDTMVQAIREHPKAFAVASKLYAQSTPGSDEVVMNQGYDYRPGHDVEPVIFSGAETKEVFAASDAASIYRIEFLGPVGMMDGDFYSGLEDVDFCMRAHLAGYEVYSEPRAKAHVSQLSDLSEAAQWHHAQKNLFFIYIKNLPFKLFWKYLPAGLLFMARSIAIAFHQGLAFQQAKSFLKCIFRLPRMLRYRRHVNAHRRQRAAAFDKVLQRSFTQR